MFDEKYLEILRCPFDPEHEARLKLEDIKILCDRCRVQFRTREGFLSLLAEEAELPQGCVTTDQLPCRQSPAPKAPSRSSAL